MDYINERFTNWLAKIMTEAVDYELIAEKPDSEKQTKMNWWVKLIDSFFSLFNDYKQERATLKSRKISLLSPPATPSPPPPSPPPLIHRVTPVDLPALVQQATPPPVVTVVELPPSPVPSPAVAEEEMPPLQEQPARSTPSPPARSPSPVISPQQSPSVNSPIHITTTQEPSTQSELSTTVNITLSTTSTVSSAKKPATPPSESDKPAKKQESHWNLRQAGTILKTVFIGGLLLSGGAIVSIFRSGTQNNSLAPVGNVNGNTSSLRSILEAQRVDLQDLRLQEPLQSNPFLQTLAQHHLTSIALLNQELSETLTATPGMLEDLSQRVEDVRHEIQDLGRTAQELAPVKVENTPLTALCAQHSAIDITSKKLQTILRNTIGDTNEAASIDPNRAIDHMRDRLDLIAKNEPEGVIAENLRKGLAAYQSFSNKHSPKISSQIMTALIDAQNEMMAVIEKETAKQLAALAAAKLKEGVSSEESVREEIKEFEAASMKIIEETKKATEKKVKDAIHNGIDETKEFISNLIHTSPQGFLLPYGSQLLHFKPDILAGGDKWNVRIYQNQRGMSDLHVQPYVELQGLNTRDLLSNPFIEGVIAPQIREKISAYHTNENTEGIGEEYTSLIPTLRPPFEGRLLPPLSPEIPNLFAQSMKLTASLETDLNNLLHAELGAEAALDFQIATLKQYLDKHSGELTTNPQLYAKIKAAAATLAQATERASAQGWIDTQSVTEKSQVLREIGKTIRHAGIHLRNHLRKIAPKVTDENQGKRVAAGGAVPVDRDRPFQTSLPKDIASRIHKPPLQLTSNVPLKEVIPGPWLALDEVQTLANGFRQNPAESIKQLRSWAATVIKDPSSLNVEMLAPLSQIATSLENFSGERAEVAAALVETVAIADHLIGKTDALLASQHLPLPQLVKQMQNAMLAGSVPQHLKEQAEALKLSHKKAYFFGEAIGDPQKSHGHYFLDDDRHEERSIPWAYFRLFRDNLAAEDIPPHIRYQLGEWRNKRPEQIAKEYISKFDAALRTKEKTLTHPENKHIVELRNVVECTARYAAKALTEQITTASKKIADNLANSPLEALEAIRIFSKNINPSSFDSTTLEMMTAAQSKQMLEALGDISQSFLSANFLAGTPLPNPETMLIQLELLTLADKVMAYSGVRELNLYQMPLEEFSGIIDGQNPFFRTFDPEMDSTRLQSIRDWTAQRREIYHMYYIDRGWRFTNHNPAQPIFTKFKGFFDPEPSKNEAVYRTDAFTLELPVVLSGEGGSSATIRQSDFRRYELSPYELAAYINTPQREKGLQIGAQGYTDPNHVFPSRSQTLPKWFYSLRNLAHFCKHTLNSGFINPRGNQATPDDFTPHHQIVEQYHGLFGDDKSTWIEHHLKGLTREHLAQYPDIPDGTTKGHQFAHLEPSIRTPGVLNEVRDLHLQPRSRYLPGIDQLPRSIYDENLAPTLDTENSRGIYSTDKYFVKRSIRAEPDIQPFLVISHYLDNPEWLTHTDEQIEFLNLLFDPGLLGRHLQKPGIGPKSTEELAKFFYNQFRIHEGNKELQLFFTEVGVRLHQYSEVARRAAPQVYLNEPIPQELQTLYNLPRKMMARTDLTEQERSSYGALYALTFLNKSPLKIEENTDFLNAVLSYHAFPPHNMVNTLHINRQIDNMLAENAGGIQHTLYPEGKLDQAILGKILKGIVDTKDIELKPLESNPLAFTNAQGTLEVNLRDGSIIQKGREGVPVPAEARLSNAYTMIHGNTAYRGKAIDRYTFEFTDAQGHINLIQKGINDRQWLLYRKFSDSKETHQLVTSEWTNFDPSTRSQEMIKWLKSEWMLTQYTHWYSGGNTPEVRLLDREGKLAYRISLGGADKHTITGIYKVDLKNNQELELADIDQPAYAWTTQLESPGFVHVWLSKNTRQGQQIEFLRFGKDGLQFSWDKNKWKLDSAPQYYVAEKQFNPVFPGQSNFLLLQTATGAERLLIPRQLPTSNPEDSFTVDLPFDRKINDQSTQSYLTVDRNLKTGKFEGIDVETNIFLSMMHLTHRDYERAHELLLKYIDHGYRFSEKEMETFDQIINGANLPFNDTPQAIAVRTLAAHIKSLNIEKNPKTKDESYQVPGYLTNRYLTTFESVPGLRLPLIEEARLFKDGLIAGDQPLEETLAAMQLADPESAREALDAALPKLLYGLGRVKIDTSVAKLATAPISVPPIAPRPPIISREVVDQLLVTKAPTTTQKLPKPLQEVFDFESEWFKNLPEPTQNLFKRYANGVREFQANRDSNTYEIRDIEAFKAKRQKLEVAQRTLTTEMKRLELKILDLANPLPKDPEKAKRLMLQIEAGTVKPVTLDKLIGVFEDNDIRNYRALNPEIDHDQAKLIDETLQTFIDLVPDWHYNKQLINAMKEAEANHALAESSTNGDLQLSLKEFITTSKGHRQFPPDAKRSMKVLEFRMGSYYRPEQVGDLGRLGLPGLATSLTEAEALVSSVHRIPVGGGKSEFLSPTVIRHRIRAGKKKGKITPFITPEAQLKSSGAAFSHNYERVYGKSAVVVEFTHTHVTPTSTAATLKKLKDALVEEQPVMTSGKSLKSLRNLFLKHLEAHLSKVENGGTDDDGAAIVENLQETIKILSGRPLLDEGQIDFNLRLETNHPSGDPVSLPAEYGIVSLNLYEILRDDREIQEQMHFNFIPQYRVAGAKPFSIERFKSDIAPLLAKKFLFSLLQDRAKLDEELLPLATFFKNLSPAQQKDVEAYVLMTHSPEVQQWVDSLSPSIRSQLGLVSGQLLKVMPTTLNHNFGERYGYVNSGDIMPTPFEAAGRANKGSIDSSPFARFDHLLQALFHEGPRRLMIDKIVKELRQDRLKELNAKAKDGTFAEIGERLETSADVEFRRMFSTDKLNLDHPHLEEELMKNFQNNPGLLRHLTKIYALPLVKVYPRNLKATNQHLGNLFRAEGWDVISGTPNNYPDYPDKSNEPQDGVVIGRMITIIAEQDGGRIHTIRNGNPKTLLTTEPCLSADAFMDAGAIFATESLEKLADAWSAATSKSNARIDPETGIVVKQNPDDRPVPLRSSHVKPEERVSLYDQPNTVGTDIPQKKNGIGIVSISHLTTFDEYEQAAGRMRKAGKGQKIETLLFEESAIIIRERLGLPPNHELSLSDLFRHMLLMSSTEQMDNSETGIRLKLRGELDNYLFNWLMENKVSALAKVGGLHALLLKQFFPEVNNDPYELFGRPDATITKEAAFDQEIDRLIGPNAPLPPLLEKIFGAEAPTMLSNLRTAMEGIKADNLKYVNKEIESRPPTDIEQEQEVLQEQETEVEQEQETEVEQEEILQAKPTKTPYLHKGWDRLTTTSIATWDFWASFPPGDIETLKKYLAPTARVPVFVNLPSLLPLNPATLDVADLFDPNIAVSTNFQQQLPLEALQKPSQLAVVIKHKETGDYRITFVEPWEAVRFEQAHNARNGISLPVGPHETGVPPIVRLEYNYANREDEFLSLNFGYTERQLYDSSTEYGSTSTGIGWQVGGPLSTEGDAEIWIGDFSGRQQAGNADVFNLQDSKLQELWAQSQVFAGRIDYPDSTQRQLIKTWLNDWATKKTTKDKPKADWLNTAETFIKKLMASKQDEVARFARSDLGKIFAELAA